MYTGCTSMPDQWPEETKVLRGLWCCSALLIPTFPLSTELLLTSSSQKILIAPKTRSNRPRGKMAGVKKDAARPGRATGLKKQKSIKSPKSPPKEGNDAPRFSFGKKSSKPHAPPSNKGLKKNQSLSRSRATSPRFTRPTASTRATSPKTIRPTSSSARPTSPKISRPTNVQARAPAKPRTVAKPKPTIKAARGNPFGSDASSSSSSVESSYAGGVVPLPSPPRTSSKSVHKKETSMASPRATSRSRHGQNTEIISPRTNNVRRHKTTEYDASNLSITSSNFGVVPITTTSPNPKPSETKIEQKKKKAKKSKSTKEKKASTDEPPKAKVEEDDKSEQSERSIAQSITETILPYLVKKSKKQDNTRGKKAAAEASHLDKEMKQKEEEHITNNDEDFSCHDDKYIIAKETKSSNNESSKKETDIHQDDDQGEHHQHRRVHAAFRGAPSAEESLLTAGDSQLETHVQLIDNIKRIETPSNAATLHKVMAALQTERENGFEAKCQLREALAELDKVKRDFSDAKESYNTENFRLNSKLTRMMDRIEQLEHEMAMSGKNFVYATWEGETEYKSAASPSTRYGARSPRAVRLSKIPWACVDTGVFSCISPYSSGGGGTEEREDSFSKPTNSLIVEEETEGDDYFSRPSSDIVARE